jgi:hypothetical protein
MVSLDPNRVFAEALAARLGHDRIMDLRNTFVAHNAGSDLIRTTIAVKEEPERILVRHLITLASPTNELESFAAALSQTEAFVESSLNRLLIRMESDRGKLIFPQQYLRFL